MKNRNRRTNNKGFTMAELILAVAIIIILGALAFVGVTRYLRSMRLLEMDNAAKELYFAAQNRITAELVSGDLGRLDGGSEGDYSADAEQTLTRNGSSVTLHVVKGPISSSDDKTKTLLDELLPFGSIDETIRSGGSYIITYTFDADNNLAHIWDVWYTAEWRGVNYKFTADIAELNILYKDYFGDDHREARKNYGTDNAVIGHYGSKGISLDRSTLEVKDLQLVNDEVLYLKGKANVVSGPLELEKVKVNIVIENLSGTAKKTFTPEQGGVTLDTDGSFLFVLDDITKSDKRFQKVTESPESGTFIPGEDIRVTVEVYTNEALANIDKASAVDNSLFQYVNPKTDSLTKLTTAEAGIGKIRHLQNLSNAVSGVILGVKNENENGHKNRLGIDSAKQTADLNWESFKAFKVKTSDPAIGGSIYYNDTNTNDSFLPINLNTPGTTENFSDSFLTYDAQYTVEENGVEVPKNHSIKNLTVNDTSKIANAGLFGTVGTSATTPISAVNGKERYLLTISNLDMEGTTINGTATAGAVVANEVNAVKLQNITIKDIVDQNGAVKATTTVTATGGNAGGAVGQAVNGLTIESVAVSESHVSASGHAGGLVGQFDGVYKDVHIMINKSFVQNSTEPETTTATYNPGFSVISTGADNSAGGLVGAITQGYPQIFNSYSTALVKGDTAGGLIGEIINSHMNTDKSEIGIIRDCYVGGHVTKNAATGMPVYSDTKYNVTGTKIAGGFIGSFEAGSDSGITVLNSYSTASASGETAGGFVGNAAGEGTGSYRISDCYAVGLVKDTNPDDVNTPSGAFAGNVGTLLFSGDRYFELISKGLPAVGNTSANPTEVFSAETNLQTYNSFVQVRKEGTFDPYHKSLDDMFGTIYYLPTVKDLDSGADKSMSIHVGDWQPVDTLVTNTPDGT